MVGARRFPGKPFDGRILSAQLEQTANCVLVALVAMRQTIVQRVGSTATWISPAVQVG